MTDEPKNRLIVLRLALEGGVVRNPDFKPTVDKSERERLVKDGLIESETRAPPTGGRKAMYLILTERGWGWLAETLDGELSPGAKLAKRPLQKLLDLLKQHLKTTGRSFAEFATLSKVDAVANPDLATLSQFDEQQIRQAYAMLSSGNPNTRVRLAELRKALPDIPRNRLDEVLLAMASRGGTTLIPLENPVEITGADRDAVLRTSSGDERHLIYLGGTPS